MNRCQEEFVSLLNSKSIDKVFRKFIIMIKLSEIGGWYDRFDQRFRCVDAGVPVRLWQRMFLLGMQGKSMLIYWNLKRVR
jgi:hypothetical protein